MNIEIVRCECNNYLKQITLIRITFIHKTVPYFSALLHFSYYQCFVIEFCLEKVFKNNAGETFDCTTTSSDLQPWGFVFEVPMRESASKRIKSLHYFKGDDYSKVRKRESYLSDFQQFRIKQNNFHQEHKENAMIPDKSLAALWHFCPSPMETQRSKRIRCQFTVTTILCLGENWLALASSAPSNCSSLVENVETCCHFCATVS